MIFCYIIIECESKKYLVKSKSKLFLVDTITGISSRITHRNLNGQKRSVLGQNPTNKLKHNDHKFGNDYSDMQNKNRNLGGKERKHGRGFGRKKHLKNQSINNNWQTERGQGRKGGRGLGQRTTFRNSKNGSINSIRKDRRRFGKREKYSKNDYNEFGNDYNNGWLSK